MAAIARKSAKINQATLSETFPISEATKIANCKHMFDVFRKTNFACHSDGLERKSEEGSLQAFTTTKIIVDCQNLS